MLKNLSFPTLSCNLSCFFNNISLQTASIQINSNMQDNIFIQIPTSSILQSKDNSTVLLQNITLENAEKYDNYYKINNFNTIQITATLAPYNKLNLNGYFIGYIPVEISNENKELIDTIYIMAEANFIQNRYFTNHADLNFGIITNTVSGGCYVTILPSSLYTTNCTNVDGVVSSGIISTTYDSENPILNIELPLNIQLTNLNNAADKIQVTNFTYEITNPINTGEELYIKIGATLTTNNQYGTYAGVVPIIINY